MSGLLSKRRAIFWLLIAVFCVGIICITRSSRTLGELSREYTAGAIINSAEESNVVKDNGISFGGANLTADALVAAAAAAAASSSVVATSAERLRDENEPTNETTTTIAFLPQEEVPDTPRNHRSSTNEEKEEEVPSSNTTASDGVNDPSPKKTTSSIGSEEKTEGKPIFVFHVGPMKTGSTTIQMALGSRDVRRRLAEDNFAYIGQIDMKPHCFMGQCGGKSEWTEYVSKLEEIGRNGTNIIMSAEYFSNVDTAESNWREALGTIAERFELRVAMVYRPFYDWIPSMYAQEYKTKIFNSRAGKFRPVPWRTTQNGTLVQSLPDYIEENYLRYLRRDEAGHSPVVPACVDSLTAFFIYGAVLDDIRGKIVVVDMHQEGRLLVNFLNASVPEATSTIRELQKWKKNGKQNQSGQFSSHITADLVVAEAYARGVVAPELDRKRIRDRVRDRMLKIGGGGGGKKHLPMKCFGEGQRDLIWAHAKLSHETMMMSPPKANDGKGDDVNELRRNFEQAIDSNRMCSIDAAELLDDPEWIRYIANETASILASV